MSDTCWEDVNFVYSEPSQKYINNEMKKIDEILSQFCRISDIEKDRIEFNVQTLKDIIIRVDMRKLYFKIYHSNMEANEYKVVLGLEGFWILKLRPFWIRLREGDSDEFMQMATCINEKIVLHMIGTLLSKYNPDFFEHGADIVKSYFKELEYSFRYRDLSKESMFLLFDPFYFMHIYNSSIDEEKKYII